MAHEKQNVAGALNLLHVWVELVRKPLPGRGGERWLGRTHGCGKDRSRDDPLPRRAPMMGGQRGPVLYSTCTGRLDAGCDNACGRRMPQQGCH